MVSCWVSKSFSLPHRVLRKRGIKVLLFSPQGLKEALTAGRPTTMWSALSSCEARRSSEVSRGSWSSSLAISTFVASCWYPRLADGGEQRCSDEPLSASPPMSPPSPVLSDKEAVDAFRSAALASLPPAGEWWSLKGLSALEGSY